MPQPTSYDVHVDAVLTNISVAYIQSSNKFMSTQAFPVVPVEKQSDLYYKYTKNDWFRDEAQRRADGTESSGSGYGLSTDSYRCDVWAFHKDVGDQMRANADNPLKPDTEATQFVTQRLMLRQEIQWVTDYFTTGVWGTDKTVSATWDDYALSDPIEDMEEAKEVVLSGTGFELNTLVLGYQVFRQLKHHPDIIDRIKYTTGVTGRTVTPELLAAMFDIERVLISKAIKATNEEGQTGAYAFTHGKHALAMHVAPNPGLMTPSAGYVFTWKGVSEGLGTDIGISRFRMQHLRSDRVEGQVAFDNKVVATDLGYFFNGAVA
jgi:hypothetical protein